MSVADRLFRAAGGALLALAALGSTPAHGQAVTNVAAARWSVGDQQFAVQSNEVVVRVLSRPERLSTFVAMPGGTETAALKHAYCPTRGPAALSQAAEQPIVTPLQPTADIGVGQRLVVRLDAPGANRDPSRVETLDVHLTTQPGDAEDVVAVESAANSGVFYAAIETTPLSPPPSINDCRLSLRGDDTIAILALLDGRPSPTLSGEMQALADPFGLVFSSRDGAPVDGARVTILDEDTGSPAEVFAFDGVTPYPATVISGQPVIDASGTVHPAVPGEYRFPMLAFGRYRLVVEPPAPFTAPSAASAEALAGLTRPDGLPYEISGGSYGGAFAVESVVPVRIDIPLDNPGGTVSLQKRASRDEAEPGDAVLYRLTVRNLSDAAATDPLRITDRFSASLRMAADSLRVDGREPGPAATADPDGRGFALALPALAPGATSEITYALTVAVGAAPGQAVNRATARAGDRPPVEASVGLRIRRDGLADRMTLVGQITAGRCGRRGEATGVRGVRVMLEDGSFAVTDADGRYHFDGVVPGAHVVRAISATLPDGGRFVDCAFSPRSAGSADSRFVSGRGGSLVRADFSVDLPATAALVADPEDVGTTRLTSQQAAGAETDWLALGDGPDEILFPATGHNPRSPAIRVVVRHRPGHSASLAVDGRAVDVLAYEGATVSPDKRYAISVWRGVRLSGESNRLTVTLRAAQGAAPTVLEREVHYADTPMVAQLVPERSRLVADGVSAPVLAVRLLDRNGRPVHAGISGSFTLEGPYQSASAIAARQNRELSGFGASASSWIVEGDEGIAFIELAPTMVSGALRVRFAFSDGEVRRETELEAWIEPGDQPWTLIGLAEGSIGARTVADNVERGGGFDSDLGDEARVAFYAKGRVLGRYLLTMSYDSVKQEADQRLLGAIDPAAYYTVYGDSAERFYDAASREKLYVRIESRAFYALYGDFETGFDQTELARYQRIATGLKSEARLGQVHAQAFAARISSRHRRDEFQGGGITGPYPLSSRAIIPNSEVVTIELRDRLRSELIVERRQLVRFVDYDIDPLSGTISFAEPLLSRDPLLNPQFAVVDYETDVQADGEWNAGLRTAWTSDHGRLRIGATAVTDKGEAERTDLAAVDVRVRLGTGTEMRAEAAMSRAGGESSLGVSAEVEHHAGALDLVAYARELEPEFGVGQQNLAERGRRKIGADARVSLTDALSVVGRAWRDDSLIDAGRRDALELRAAWRSASTDAYLGIAHMSDRLAEGDEGQSTILTGGATQRLLDQRLELSASSSLALSETEAIDLPARHRFGARYAITPQLRAVGTYEIAEGEAIEARTLQAGLELSPWRGSKVVTTLGSQAFGADAQRTFASVALGQSIRVSDTLTLDATLDGNRTIGGAIAPSDTFSPHHPVSSGGHLGEGGLLGEDFTAATLGAAWQKGRWSSRVRGEYRDGELVDRKGLTMAAIRQLGEGSVVGSGLRWTRADQVGGASSEVQDAAISVAHRPAGSPLSLLGKLEYRSDEIRSATAGAEAPVGPSRLTVDGDARSRRLLGSLSGNWTPRDGSGRERGELGLFLGMRHNLDRFGDFDLAHTTLLVGGDARVAVAERLEIGGRATVRASLSGGATRFAAGPEVGFVPADNMLLSVGYNVVGFRDPDFAAARHTDRGLYAAIKMKFDERSFEFLGLGRR